MEDRENGDGGSVIPSRAGGEGPPRRSALTQTSGNVFATMIFVDRDSGNCVIYLATVRSLAVCRGSG